MLKFTSHETLNGISPLIQVHRFGSVLNISKKFTIVKSIMFQFDNYTSARVQFETNRVGDNDFMSKLDSNLISHPLYNF